MDNSVINYVIKTHRLCKSVLTSEGKLDILIDIEFAVATGDTLAIVGTSGSGKSTLLSLLAGLDTASTGDVVLFGQSLASMDEDARAKLRNQTIGFVFQSFLLLNNLTALENVMLPLELAGDRHAQDKAKALLAHVGLGQRLNHTPAQLSGGEQQRVALARAFVTHPKVLFADEPTGNLDRKTGNQIMDLLFQLNQEQGTTLLLVTHDSMLANRCHRQITLESGRLV